jgi:hypothetical protein
MLLAIEKLILQLIHSWQNTAGTGIHNGHFVELAQARVIGVESFSFDHALV